jgi:hypothetical protein
MRTVSAVARCAVTLCAFGVAGAARADAVVVSSTAPGLAQGQVVADAAAVMLPDDATATFLLASGQILRLMGPYHGPVSVQPANGGAQLALLDGHDLSALGGVRSSQAPRLDGLRAPVRVDADNGGTYCVAADTPVTLMRKAPSDDQLQLAGSSGRTATVRWPDRSTEQPWPAGLPTGGSYTLTWNGQSPRSLTFRPVDNQDGNDAAMLARMVAGGCEAQVAPLLRQLGEQTSPLALWLGTERGRVPRYAPGEEMTLVVQANRDAHVYCFAPGPLGLAGVSPSGLDSGFVIPGNIPVRISGRRLPGGPPQYPGEQRQVRCWATTADIADRLPAQLAGLPADEAGRRVESAIDQLRAVQSAEARLVLRVE